MDESVFLHPSALSDAAEIGSRTKIWAFVRLQPGCRIGEDCQLCDYAGVGVDVVIGNRVTIKEYAAIGQGTVIEDDVFIGPSVITPNDERPRSRRMKGNAAVERRYAADENWLTPTRIGQGATIGTGSIIGPGTTIGPYAMVGMGSLVHRDVPAHRKVVGNPSRPVGWVCFCGARLEKDALDSTAWSCSDCDQAFRLVDDDSMQAIDSAPEAKPQ